jgi:hypothetical protein
MCWDEILRPGVAPVDKLFEFFIDSLGGLFAEVPMTGYLPAEKDMYLRFFHN